MLVASVLQANSTSAASICDSKIVTGSTGVTFAGASSTGAGSTIATSKKNTNIASTSASRTGNGSTGATITGVFSTGAGSTFATSNVLQAYTLRVV